MKTEKYKHLFKLENDVISFIKRFKNVYGERAPRQNLINYINLIDIPDEVIDDAINLVCELNNITIIEYIDKLNYFFDLNSINNIGGKSHINNKEELINLYKKKLTPYRILSEPIYFNPLTNIESYWFYINTAKKLWRILPINNFL